MATLATLEFCFPMPSSLKSALLSLYQLAFLSILMALVKCCGFLMQLSNITSESTFLYSLQVFSFSWLVWSILAALLFSWQWLLYLPRWRIFKWSRNPKIQTFIETYHKPYIPKHRLAATGLHGLLLIVRVVLYLVAATKLKRFQ